MATENNQNTKSMNSLESNARNTIGNDIDRKHSSQDIKCEISTDQDEIEIEKIKKECNDREWEYWMIKPLKSINNCGELRAEVHRLEYETWEERFGSTKVVENPRDTFKLKW